MTREVNKACQMAETDASNAKSECGKCIAKLTLVDVRRVSLLARLGALLLLSGCCGLLASILLLRRCLGGRGGGLGGGLLVSGLGRHFGWID